MHRVLNVFRWKRECVSDPTSVRVGNYCYEYDKTVIAGFYQYVCRYRSKAKLSALCTSSIFSSARRAIGSVNIEIGTVIILSKSITKAESILLISSNVTSTGVSRIVAVNGGSRR